MSRAFRPLLRISVALAVVVVVMSARVGAATLLDPLLRFQTIQTEHFRIYFHGGEEELAQRLATIAEDVWPKVGSALGVAGPKRTHVILVDQSSLANGWATPLPYDTIFVTAAAPAGSEYIGRNDDWMRLVFTHEFTHIVHLDRSEGWARIFRGIFGRSPIVFPNAWLPQWQIEGLAAWYESALTGDGRLHAGDFRAVEHEAVRSGQVPRLDRMNGGLIDWPDGLAPYAFGLGFHDYLSDRFGQATFAELARRTSRSLPLFGSRAFKRVYGSSLGTLWRDYRADLARAVTQPEAEATTRLTKRGFTVLGPRFTRSGDVIYSSQDPHGFPSLRTVRVDGSGDRRMTTRYFGSTVGLHDDVVIFNQLELRRNAGLYSDLYLLDRRTGDVRRVTHDQRLLDPDLSPDGDMIAAVRQRAGSRELVTVRLSDAAHTVTVLVSENETQFNAPRWSPDARSLAVERHRLGAESEIVVVDVTTGSVRTIASDSQTRIVTPAWRPDGRAVVAAADYGEGPFNLYEFDALDSGQAARQITHTLGGALWPDVSADGRTIVFSGYTPQGFDVFTVPYTTRESQAITAPAARPVPGVTRAPTAPIRGYSPWPTLLPTSWSPVLRIDDQTRAGFSTSGYDVLQRHLYSASASWLVSAPADAITPRAAVPDWQAAYIYDRWVPALFVGASSATEFGAGRPDSNGRPTPATRRATEVEGGVVVPFRHVRASHRLTASLLRGFDRFTLPTQTLSTDRGAVRFAAATNTSRQYGYSISSEDGLRVGATSEFVRTQIGSRADATTFTADARAYVSGFAEHHVVALRLAGGSSSGDERFDRTFLLGGAAVNSDVTSFSRDAISLLRGFPLQEFAGTHVALANADYRWPIAWPQRGIGTWPFFLQSIHAAVFGDVGHAWTTTFRRQDVKTSFGGELAFDVVAGYGFPFTVVLGGGWGHDGAVGENRAAYYLRLGRAF